MGARATQVLDAVDQVVRHRLALDRQDTEHRQDSEAAGFRDEATPGLRVENRLRDHKSRACGGLAPEQLELALDILSIWIRNRPRDDRRNRLEELFVLAGVAAI